MTIICKSNELYEAIVNVSKAVFKKSTLLVLEGIKINVKETSVELTGYDLEIGIQTEISASSTGTGQFVVNARLLGEMIKKMNSEDVTLEVIDNQQIKVYGGDTEYTIMYMNAVEFPTLPTVSDDAEVFEISQPVLKSMINQTIFAVAQTDAKPVLKGELFEIDNNKLTVVAIDGYRLAVRDETIKYDGQNKMIIPSKALYEISKLLKDDDELTAKIFISRKHVIFEFSGYTVYSRLIEGEFHNYKGSIPDSENTEVIIDKKEFINSLERASILINERIKSPVRCVFNNGALSISCVTSIGKINDKISADITGPMMEIGFNCKFLLDPLKVIEEDKVKLLMNGGNLPMKIVPVNGEGYTFLVLPVRLKSE
ncbi:MAG: DNA polymerase III subunit beta [Ruminococcus sp.]|nr:DNA polymerase III subunit beta [Ruminococcus sp.]